MTDVIVQNHSTIWLFDLQTDAAEIWVEENVIQPHYYCDVLVVEHCFARDLVLGMRSAGLCVVSGRPVAIHYA